MKDDGVARWQETSVVCYVAAMFTLGDFYVIAGLQS